LFMAPDVVVVGGGPVGCRVAEGISPYHETLVVEEHRSPGRPVQCAGLVTPRVVEMVRGRDATLNELRGAEIHFPGGEVLEIRSPEVKAEVVDRECFDGICMDRAVDAGAEYLTEHRFRGLSIGSEGANIKLETPSGRLDINASLVVGADGYKSGVAGAVGLGKSRELVRGIEVDVSSRMDDQDMVQVFLGSDIAPGFFAWTIPCGDFTRAGLCVSNGAPNRFLGELLKRSGLDGGRRIRTMAGVIPLGTIQRSYGERVMVVGDAAGQAKPISGGGVYTGMVAADHASRTACLALDEDDASARSLSRYEKDWKEDIGKELDRGYRLRKVFLRMTDSKLDDLAKVLKRPQVVEILNKGDIDHPTLLAPKILRMFPSLIRFSPQVLGSFLTR